MTHQNNLAAERMITPALIKRMLVGGGIALFLISLLLSTVEEPDPAWGSFWMIRPLIIVPLAGAAGAIFYHFVDERYQREKKKFFIDFVCLIIYVFALWMGTVLGLDGTLWN